MSVGIVFASTGGMKIVRAVRSFQKIEPLLAVHVIFDISSNSWKSKDQSKYVSGLRELGLQHGHHIRYVENNAHINGTLNRAMEWMKELGYSHACLFHDDLVFSPFAEHRESVSCWFNPELLGKSAITFSHLEAFKSGEPDRWARRHPDEWDAIDMESEELWKHFMTFKRENAYGIHPPDADFFVHYEGCDVVRKWNRLGPTGQVVPIDIWEQVGKFDEVDCVHYDQDYTVKCFRAGLKPNYAVPNIPWVHLHNQSMNPWFDPAPGMWGRTEAMVKKFGANWEGIWGNDWEEKWHD